MKAAAPKIRARAEILHYVLSFCVSRQYGTKDNRYPAITAFCPEGGSNGKPIAGDLVLLSSAPVSKWTLGWLVEIDLSNPGWPRYLLESLEDGALAWWDNVGIAWLDREVLSYYPEWRWSDRQFAFKARWWRVCYRDKDAYIVRPLMPEFGEGFAVTLGTRTSHGMDDIRPTRSFPDWRKVTRAMMAACYDDCVAERAAIMAARKAEQAA